jgi:hypothetical protein
LPDARGLEAIVAKCLAKRPDDRHLSALELAKELERWLAGEPIQTRRPRGDADGCARSPV